MFGELNDRGLLAFNGRERHGIRKLLNIFKPFQALIPGLVRMDFNALALSMAKNQFTSLWHSDSISIMIIIIIGDLKRRASVAE